MVTAVRVLSVIVKHDWGGLYNTSGLEMSDVVGSSGPHQSAPPKPYADYLGLEILWTSRF
jgi:hypothetical protein